MALLSGWPARAAVLGTFALGLGVLAAVAAAVPGDAAPQVAARDQALAAALAEEGWAALPVVAPVPADNPTTAERVALGKMLFFDPRLSSSGTVSCFACHNVMEGGDDHRSTSVGVHGQVGGRNAPSVWNAAFLTVQFWDGRAASLEDQAKGPPTNPIEMGMANLDAVVDRIRHIPGYRPYFDAAFGGAAGEPVTMDNAARAIAAYERTLLTPDSPYDRYVGGDRSALSAQQVRGMKAFAGAGCTACHSGPMFAGPVLPEGAASFMKFPTFEASPYVARYDLARDPGRMAVTHADGDAHMWRVPSLRNLEYTAPYFHNGKVQSIEEAVRVMASTQLGRTLPDGDVADISAFLHGLTGRFPDQVMPRLPPTPGDLLE